MSKNSPNIGKMGYGKQIFLCIPRKWEYIHETLLILDVE